MGSLSFSPHGWMEDTQYSEKLLKDQNSLMISRRLDPNLELPARKLPSPTLVSLLEMNECNLMKYDTSYEFNKITRFHQHYKKKKKKKKNFPKIKKKKKKKKKS